LAFDSIEGEKLLKLEEQNKLHNQFLKLENGKIKEQFENNNNNNKKNSENVDLSKYILKSKLKPDKKCPDLKDFVSKLHVPTCKTCPDMDGYLKKTEIPTCPPPTDMSQYVHVDDLNKDKKPFWHHLMEIADTFKKHFIKNIPKPIETEHPPEPGSDSKSEPESKPEPEYEPEPEKDSYGNDTQHMSLFGEDDLLRPSNSFTCNGYAPKRTDTCYYY
jgi:hypothetical protein